MDDGGHVLGDYAAELVGTGVLAQGGRAVAFANKDGVGLPPNGLYQSGDEDFPSESEQRLESPERENKPREATVHYPEKDGVENLTRQLLSDQCPYAETFDGHYDADDAACYGAGKGNQGLGLEIDVFCHPCPLGDGEGVDDNDEREYPDDLCEGGHLEKQGDGRGTEVENGGDGGTDAHIADENGAVIDRIDLLFPYDGVAHPAVDKTVAEGDKDKSRAHDAIFVGGEQACQYDADDKGDAIV